MSGVDFSDLDDGLVSAAVSTQIDIKSIAHIANGGEALFDCPKCSGRGTVRLGWSSGRCFKCNGKGKVSKGVVAAAKGKATKEANRRAYVEDHRDEIAYIQRRADRSNFFASILEKFNTYGKFTDGQLAAIHKDMAEEPARIAAFKARREEAAPEVNISAIEALFGRARESGLKKLAFRTKHIDVSAAKETGSNPGALYVKHDGEYVGKIVSGKFIATRAATSETLPLLLAVAADPTGAAKFYGRDTGKCSCCGRELTDPTSVELGIGPICADKWGL